MASGAFVAITANTSGYNNVRVTGMHGISFGYNQQVYLTVASHYYTYDDRGSTYISDASLTVEPGLNSSKSADLPMLISYPNLQRFKINGSSGYSGDVTLVSGVHLDSVYKATPIDKTYKFQNGFLLNT